MKRYLCVVSTLAIVAVACGDEECPAGTVREGEGCVAITDSGVEGGDGGDAADAGDVPDSCTPTMYYRDGDSDGFGDADDSMLVCGSPPPGYADVPPTDCDDTTAAINPYASETCDGVDEDCDGAVDEGRLGLIGSPVSIGELEAGMGGSPSLDRFSGGYVAVWNNVGVTGRLLDRSGNFLSGLNIDTASAAAGQHQPSMAVIRSVSDLERAVVAWATDDGTVRARSLRLDGLTSPASVVIAVGDGSAVMTSIRVVEWNHRALLVWVPYTLGDVDGQPLRAQLLDPETAMPIGSAVTVAEHSGAVPFTPPGVSILFDGSALLATIDPTASTYVAARLVVEGTTLTVAETTHVTPPRALVTAQVVPIADSRTQGIVFANDDQMGLDYVAIGSDPLAPTTDTLTTGSGRNVFIVSHEQSMMVTASSPDTVSPVALELTQVVRTMGESQLVRAHLFDLDPSGFVRADLSVATAGDVAILLLATVSGRDVVQFATAACR